MKQISYVKGHEVMSKKLFFVFNPLSGKAQIKNNLLKIINTFAKNGWTVTVHPTQCVNDAYNTIKAQAHLYDLLVIAGGDGTLNEGIQALMSLAPTKRPAVGYIPTGTTNDFASNLRIPKNMSKAAENIMSGHAFGCDIGAFNDKNFVYVAAFGAFTDVAYETPQQNKNLFGQTAYILEGIKKLPNLKSKHVKIKSPEIEIEDDFIFGMVSNTNSVGGFKAGKAFRAELNDGLFEVVLIRNPKNMIERQEVLTNLLTQELTSDAFCVFKTNNISITSDEPIQWTLDGEFGGNCENTNIRIENEAITFIIG